MAVCKKWHKELDENGEGKCSVPMWRNGVPAGFCDKPAFGKPLPYETFRGADGKIRRYDGGFCGYVPYLACPAHGGPKNNSQLTQNCTAHPWRYTLRKEFQMGVINISVQGSFRNKTSRQFSAMHGGHAQAVAEAIEFLSKELLSEAIEQDQ